MAKKTFDIAASEVRITGDSRFAVRLEFEAELRDVVDLVSVEEIVKALSSDDLLQEIGSEKAMSYWGLKEDNGE